MTSPAELLTLPDGRRLEYLTGGAPDGLALVHHSGTPSAAVVDPSLWDAAGRAGLRLVTCSRPGYGASTPRPAPEGWPVPLVADADDTAALLDHLGIDEFVTLGHSGGGPRALACAATMPQRCRSVALLAGVAPFDAAGLDWSAGMGPENVRDFAAAASGREAYLPIATEQAAELGAVTADDIVAAFGGLVDEVDAAALTGGFAGYVAASFRHAMAQGPGGMVEDTLQIVRPWGFDVAEVTVPTSVWQGAHDKMVPFEHGRWLAAAIPGARAHLFDDEGHISLVARFEEILADLRDLASA
ncbi:alpha/beta fold hydrolase [Nocardioides sp. zg-1228]|uniref:alpha/beta fold hydrolase n=1 Tax=Nocardioides sp. zg-1228 TaxID=2763008 RepID=UPI0016433C81|nr:alpha/beta hydrolase [Nocardioides sp. zg-1228]MBC2933022.1 alpha/beta hydrolase [Nocardioides sp. zg-1228]QSF56783.1 alpha/beta hydrolase [Nocardioides sp. zg-1228]